MRSIYLAYHVLQYLPPVSKCHTFVQSLLTHFTFKPIDYARREYYQDGSNGITLEFKNHNEFAYFLNNGIDYKVINNKYYVRFGYGINNLSNDIINLCKVIEKN